MTALGRSGSRYRADRRHPLGHVEEPRATITPHSLRRTAASLAISSGASVLPVQRMLAHASEAMTLDVSSDLFEDDLDAAADTLNNRALQTNVAELWANVANLKIHTVATVPESPSDQHIQWSRLSESN